MTKIKFDFDRESFFLGILGGMLISALWMITL